MHRLFEDLNSAYGFDFTEYAKSSAMRRVMYFMEIHKIPTISDLTRILLRNEHVFASFVQEFTVNVTEMFRDPEFYQALRQTVVKKLSSYPVIKIWIAGCSTGEEAYSTAILLEEEGLLNRSIIYATDLNPRVVFLAKKGVYSQELMELYGKNYNEAGGKKSLSDYYTADYGSVIFDSRLKKHMVFSVHNLAADTSFNEFQLILCRNVLIYFNQSLQNRVFNLFHDSLCTFGYLGLGSKESMLFSDKRHDFVEVDRNRKIFKRKY
ncbi:CheR family methyltransferase [Litoribacter ruber]|uniref:CheR family methyltransferase n=1 Tax=Litoribacter ruber TaxID=702568 RepID=UPI00293D7E9C|nr:protein-glutamate O-methyltransferase CheR [Litoribacter alkaliphilus]